MTISSSISAFQAATGDDLTTGDRADPAQLQALESKFGLPVPDELKAFYADIGSLLSDDLESNCIQMESAGRILEQLAEPDRWYRLHSTGLIDVIKYSWTNDRPEFDASMDAAAVAQINARYQGFGLWRGFDILEGAHYLYFDEFGKFGAVYYHQDNFDKLLQGQLLPMLAHSPATQTLDDCLQEAFTLIGRNILSGTEDR